MDSVAKSDNQDDQMIESLKSEIKEEPEDDEMFPDRLKN